MPPLEFAPDEDVLILPDRGDHAGPCQLFVDVGDALDDPDPDGVAPDAISLMVIADALSARHTTTYSFRPTMTSAKILARQLVEAIAAREGRYKALASIPICGRLTIGLAG